MLLDTLQGRPPAPPAHTIKRWASTSPFTQSLLGTMFGDRCQVKKDHNTGVISTTVSNIQDIPKEQNEDSYSQHSSLPCAQ